jgi:hypothetical protein
VRVRAAVFKTSLLSVGFLYTTPFEPNTMSPQQMSGEKPCATDDLYALGATLYELLSGRPPFYTGNIPHQVMNVPAKALEQRQAELEVNNPVPTEVSATVLACLAKDRAQRPQSMQSVVQRIWGGEARLDQAEDASAPAGGEKSGRQGHVKPWWIWGRVAATGAGITFVGYLLWPSDGGGRQKRVFRGASWVDPHREMLASANRLGTGDVLPEARCDTVGFRVVLEDGGAVAEAHRVSPAALDDLKHGLVLHFEFERDEADSMVADSSGSPPGVKLRSMALMKAPDN